MIQNNTFYDYFKSLNLVLEPSNLNIEGIDLSNYNPLNYLATRLNPSQILNPEWLHWNNDLARNLNINYVFSACSVQESENKIKNNPDLESELLQGCSGKNIFPKSKPICTKYGGFQFGHWAGQLGDGRAHLLGDRLDLNNTLMEIQLKGSGQTPYSRHGDGKAVLRSSLREYFASECLKQLGIPTTEALACVLTNEEIPRDMFYDGRVQNEPGAIVTRVAPSFLRFGHFEILSHTGRFHDLKQLIGYVLMNYYSDLIPKSFYEVNNLNKVPNTIFPIELLDDSLISNWFNQICQRTAGLVVEWMRVGFVHGVLNTDNMSILGLTIDFGPFGFMDEFNFSFTPNTTDRQNRYCYSNQPEVVLWNLNQLANALSVIMKQPNLLISGLQTYQNLFQEKYFQMMLAKLGLTPNQSTVTADQILIQDLLEIISEKKFKDESLTIDWTLFFKSLESFIEKLQLTDQNIIFDSEVLHNVFCSVMYLNGNLAMNLILNNNDVLNSFYDLLKIWLDKYLKRIQIEQSLTGICNDKLCVESVLALMKKNNPFFVLRNYMIPEILKNYDHLQNNPSLQNENLKILKQDVDQLFNALKNPYKKGDHNEKYIQRRPNWASEFPGCNRLSCSS